jgi:integrase
MSENIVNNALRGMGYYTKVGICGHGFRTIACSTLIESGLWSRDAVKRQMSHQERNSVREVYIHKAGHQGERRLMVQWWVDYLDGVKEEYIPPCGFAKC